MSYKKPLIVSYYTPDYRPYADRLIVSLDRFDLPHDIQAIPARGKWIENIYYRAEFIRDMMTKYTCPLIWLDADAQVMAYPDVLMTLPDDVDFAARYFRWPPSIRHPNGIKEVMGGTMYFAFSFNSIMLLLRWVKLNKSMPRQKRSQLVLHEAINQTPAEKIKILELPEEYTYIPRFMPGVKHPVIWHHQASNIHRNPEAEGFDNAGGEP